MFKKKRIYMDYAAQTPIDKRVICTMKPYLGNSFGNPSSWYKEGVASKDALLRSRKEIANIIHSMPQEIVFTSGGTESNNMAVWGAINHALGKGIAYDAMHIIVSAIEHSSIMETAKALEKKGVSVDYVDVDRDGVVILKDLENKINDNTILVSIMMVNNEIGSVQPIREISKIIKKKRKVLSIPDELGDKYPIFHTDACQSILLETNVEKLGVDLLTLDSGKMYGPRSTGLLYIKRETPIDPLFYGGGQEAGMRSGTENIANIVGFATAMKICNEEREKEMKRLTELREELYRNFKDLEGKLTKNNPRDLIIPNSRSNTNSPHILSVSIPGVNSEYLTIWLDARGIMCSTKSSCLKDADESYVLKTMHIDSKSTIRISLGRFTRNKDIDKLCDLIYTFLSKDKSTQLKLGNDYVEKL